MCVCDEVFQDQWQPHKIQGSKDEVKKTSVGRWPQFIQEMGLFAHSIFNSVLFWGLIFHHIVLYLKSA